MPEDHFDLPSFTQLVHELIDGVIRRNTFNRWEMELLFDFQACRFRKSSRPDLLRRYLKTVHQEFSDSGNEPLRLSHFIDRENQQRLAARASA